MDMGSACYLVLCCFDRNYLMLVSGYLAHFPFHSHTCVQNQHKVLLLIHSCCHLKSCLENTQVGSESGHTTISLGKVVEWV